MKAALPRTNDDYVAEFESEISKLNELIIETHLACYQALEHAFEQKGGCPMCRGRGWVMIWDTMDSMSGCHVKYEKCSNPECTEETRRVSGLHPEHTKYDSNHGINDPVSDDPLFIAFVKPMKDRINDLQSQMRLFRTYPEMNDDCVIVKGRKAPIGFVGRLFWQRSNKWGVKVGLKNAKGEVAWTYLANIRVVAK